MSDHAELRLVPRDPTMTLKKLLCLLFIMVSLIGVPELGTAQAQPEAPRHREQDPQHRHETFPTLPPSTITERDILGQSQIRGSSDLKGPALVGDEKTLAPPKLRAAKWVPLSSPIEDEGQKKTSALIIPIATLFIITSAAVLLGLAQRAVFFMDVEDVILTCLTWVAPLLGILGCALLDLSDDVVPFVTLLPFIGLLLLTFARSVRFNHSILVGCAMATGKLLFVPLMVLPFLGGGNSDKRRSNTRSLLPLVMVSLLVVALVNGKKVAEKRAANKDTNGVRPDSDTKANPNQRDREQETGTTGATADKTENSHGSRAQTSSKRTTHGNAESGSQASRAKQRAQEARSDRSHSEQNTSSSKQHQSAHSSRADTISKFVFNDNADPYHVLGLSKGASRAEIREAYMRLIQQNHPDKVAAMDPAIREVAARRASAINRAYQELIRV